MERTTPKHIAYAQKIKDQCGSAMVISSVPNKCSTMEGSTVAAWACPWPSRAPSPERGFVTSDMSRGRRRLGTNQPNDVKARVGAACWRIKVANKCLSGWVAPEEVSLLPGVERPLARSP